MGMDFIHRNGVRAVLDDSADILQLLYNELGNGDGGAPVKLGEIASDQLWEVMRSIATGRPEDPCIDVHYLLMDGDCEWSRRELNYLADLTEVLRYSTTKIVTPVEAIEIMLPHFRVGEVKLHYVLDITGWRVESGHAFEHKFGRRVNLPLVRGPFINPHK